MHELDLLKYTGYWIARFAAGMTTDEDGDNAGTDGGKTRAGDGGRQRPLDRLGHRQDAGRHGAELAFTYQGEALAKRVKPLAEQAGSCFVMPCDVEDIASVDAVFDEIKKQWGTLDFLVHAVAFSNKRRIEGPLRRYDARELHPHDGDLLLRLHRGGQARRRADAERRRDADADL